MNLVTRCEAVNEHQTFHGNGAIQHCTSVPRELFPRFTYVSFKVDVTIPNMFTQIPSTRKNPQHTHATPSHTHLVKVKNLTFMFTFISYVSLAPVLSVREWKRARLSIMIKCVTLGKVLLWG